MQQNKISTQTPQEDVERHDLNQFVHDLFRIVWTGRWWIVLSTVSVFMLASGVVYLLPTVYDSNATILIVDQQISKAVVSPDPTETIAQNVEMATRRILSRPQLLEIMDETGVFADEKGRSPDRAVELMRKAIKIAPVDVPRADSFTAFSISFNAPTPAMARQITTRLCSLFIEQHSETESNRAVLTAQFVRDRISEKQKEVQEVERRIREYKLQYATELPDERASNEERIGELRIQLQNISASLDKLRQQRVASESMLRGELSARLSRLQSERATLLARFTARHPEVVKKDEEIASLEALLGTLQLDQGRAQKEFSTLALIDPRLAQLAQQVESDGSEIETLSTQQKQLESSIGEYQRHVTLAPAREGELAAMTRDLDALNAEIANLEKSDQQSQLSADMEKNQAGQQFRILDPPSLATAPSSPKRLEISLGAFAAGFALGLLAAFLREKRIPTFHRESELRQRFAAPLILSLPLLPTPSEKKRRKWTLGLELAASAFLSAATVLVAFYIYKHP